MPPKYKFAKEAIIQAALDIARTAGFRAVTARAVGAKLNSSSKVIFSLFKNMEELQRDVIAAANKIYLFKLLFMRDRSEEPLNQGMKEIRPLIELIQKNTGLGEQEAYLFHLEMWVYVHGIATMLATNYLEWDWTIISRMLTDSYEGLKKHYIARGNSE